MCSVPRISGFSLDIKETCDAQETTCPGFASVPELVGIRTTMNTGATTLSTNQMCTMEIDATAEAAHVTFIEEGNNLGVMYPGYVLGQPIRVDKGS